MSHCSLKDHVRNNNNTNNNNVMYTTYSVYMNTAFENSLVHTQNCYGTLSSWLQYWVSKVVLMASCYLKLSSYESAVNTTKLTFICIGDALKG